MAAQFCEIPLLSPFRWYKNTETPGIHFGDDWYFRQIKSFEQRRPYLQKWQWKDYTKQQIISTIAPSSVQVVNVDTGDVLDTISWSLVASGGLTGANVYECTVNLDAAYNLGENRRLILYFKAEQGLNKFEWITEPIWVEDLWPNSLIFEFYNTDNRFGCVFTTGYKPRFRCEAAIDDMRPDRNRVSFVSELNDVSTQSATPFRTYKLYIGKAPGVAPWVADLLNRIWCCNRVLVSNDPGGGFKRYESTDGAKWEYNTQKGAPGIGCSLEIIEAINGTSIQQNVDGPNPGIVVAYINNADFWGSGNEVLVEEYTITN